MEHFYIIIMQNNKPFTNINGKIKLYPTKQSAKISFLPTDKDIITLGEYAKSINKNYKSLI